MAFSGEPVIGLMIAFVCNAVRMMYMSSVLGTTWECAEYRLKVAGNSLTRELVLYCNFSAGGLEFQTEYRGGNNCSLQK